MQSNANARTFNREVENNVMSEFDNMHNALKEFLKSANNLSDNWDNDYPTVFAKYPKYLPSFDEFVADMAELVAEPDSPELKEWFKGIK